MCIAEDKCRRDPGMSLLLLDASVVWRDQQGRPQNTEQKLPALTTGDAVLPKSYPLKDLNIVLRDNCTEGIS